MNVFKEHIQGVPYECGTEISQMGRTIPSFNIHGTTSAAWHSASCGENVSINILASFSSSDC